MRNLHNVWNVHNEPVNDLIIGIMPILYLAYCVQRVHAAGMLEVLSFFPPVWCREKLVERGLTKGI